MPQAAGMAQGRKGAVKQCSLCPGCLVGSGMPACCQLNLRRKNQLLSLPAPACTSACLCPRRGLKCQGWGAASAGTWFVLVAWCHQRPWDVASATRGPDATADSRRQQTPRSPSVTALIAACRHWGSFGFHLPEVSGAESMGSWKPGGNLGNVPAGLVSPQPSSAAQHPTPLGLQCQKGSML